MDYCITISRIIRPAMLLLFILSGTARAQGDRFILFSQTGDTIITRTSCAGPKKDTLTTYFNVLKNVSGDLKLISVFGVEEPGKRSIPCADFQLVAPDTIAKYGLYTLGYRGLWPKRFKIKSEILDVDTIYTGATKLAYHRKIKHRFKIRRRTFYTATVWDIVPDPEHTVRQPKIAEVYGNKELSKYHFVIILVSQNVNQWDREVTTVNAHTRIIN